ncbi:MAG: serine/threonine-protein kinase, partial [Pirellulaceae bacterium]|nr:serine/threonine-protein kinase [Pirellulaceae bacterium]
MAETKNCPRCGAELPGDASEQPCPACLMQLGLASWANQSSPAQTEAISQPPIPSLAELSEHFPQLELLEVVGQGGMGAVFKARQKSLDRIVALKIILAAPTDSSRGDFADRFEREARALAKLNHANIVSIIDFGKANDEFFFIMEYVDGTDLRQLMLNDELTPEQALAIVPQVCEALQYAHEEGIVHRDVKPENILIDRRGRVKIADFGLAKLLRPDKVQASLTRTHQVVGTPRYMAPEQMEGAKEVDHRADIFSLGVVFYEMLTGELPMGVFQPPSRRRDVDARLDEVVLRTLEKEPQHRYQHASEVKTDVESIATSAPDESAEKIVDDVLEVAAAALKPFIWRFEVPSVYSLLPIVLAGFLLISVFTPWTETQITQHSTARLVGRYLSAGSHHWHPLAGAAAAAALVINGLFHIEKAVSSWRATLGCGAALAVGLSATLVWLGEPLTPNIDGVGDAYRALTSHRGERSTVSAMQHLQMLSNSTISIRVSGYVGLYCSMFFAFCLGIVSAFELRAVEQETVEEDAEATAVGLATQLRTIAFCLPVALACVVVANLLDAVFYGAGPIFGWHHNLLLISICTHLAHTLIGFPLLLLGARGLRNPTATMLPRVAAVIAVLPLSCLSLLAVPVTIRIFRFYGAGRNDEREKDDASTAAYLTDSLRLAGRALSWISIVQLVAAVAAMLTGIVVANSARHDAEFFLALALPTILLAQSLLLVWSTIRMARLDSRGWTRAAAVLAMIPCSPFCLLTLPLGVWSWSLLSASNRDTASAVFP